MRIIGTIAALVVASFTPLLAQESRPGETGINRFMAMGVNRPDPAPDRPEDEGEGPFERLVIRGATLIDGTGSPPVGPVDIVVENDRITQIAELGPPSLAINPALRPDKGDFEIDASGHHILPGFVDTHVHINSPYQGLAGEIVGPEYVFKLWLAHGVTTVREVGALMGLAWTLDHKRRSDAGEITSPRLMVHALLTDFDMPTPEAARIAVRAVHDQGADGLKFLGARPSVMKAAIEEAQSLGLKTAYHHAQRTVTRVNALTSARWGLDSMEHWYGLPEALFDDRTVQNYPADYNYADEQHRFGEAGRLWKQAAPRGSAKRAAVIEEFLDLDFTLSPTLTIYEANRDVMRAKEAEWHETYTHPALARHFRPNPSTHGSPHFDWTTGHEIAWRENFRLWMEFLNDYKNAGGRVTTGSDSGFFYRLFGFGYIRELELLQEAGFHPLEVIRAATLNGAELIGKELDLGSVEVGKKADFVLVEENPLANFKVLYGTGHERFNWETGQNERVGGVRYTIKDGIVWDAPALLASVKSMVDAAKQHGEPE